MKKIEDLNLSNKNKEILKDYKFTLKNIKHKEENTTVVSYIEDISIYLEYMEKKHIKTALNIKYDDINSYIKYISSPNV